jgi:hypothetical protein
MSLHRKILTKTGRPGFARSRTDPLLFHHSAMLKGHNHQTPNGTVTFVNLRGDGLRAPAGTSSGRSTSL